MEESAICPQCSSENVYFDGTLHVCPDCSYEWTGSIEQVVNDVAKDSNGSLLSDGDDVTLIKDLKVKGSSVTLKRGTKVRGIRLTENVEEVDCRIEGMSIVLKTCF